MAFDLAWRYLPVALFALICLLFPVLTFIISRYLRPDHPTPLKDLVYECGEMPEGEATIQFHFSYYVFALVFVVFDVAAIFLLLWALSFGAGIGGGAGFLAMILFVAVMFAATNYALKKEEVLYL